MPGKIVFINQATGYLTIDIINEFAKEFDEVALITGSIRIQDTPINQKVKVSKIIRYNRGSNFRKAASWIGGTFQIFFLLISRYRQYERFYFTIPPTAYLMALSLRSSYTITVYDLYPEALKANGYNEKSYLYRWWRKKNHKIFPKAHRVFTLSENMKAMIQQQAPGSDVRVISNWSAFSGYTPVKKEENSIIKKEGLESRFIVQYSGNIGVTHNVETLVEVADILKIHDDILFLIIGRGKRRTAIAELIKKKSLANCKLLPFRKDEEVYESLCTADLAVITLDDKTADISVPSKAYNIMAAGVPFLAIAPSNSAASGIIDQYQAGRAFNKKDIQKMAEYILELKNNPVLRNKLAANSLKASRNFTDVNAVKYLEYYKG